MRLPVKKKLARRERLAQILEMGIEHEKLPLTEKELKYMCKLVNLIRKNNTKKLAKVLTD